jgi:carbonic anhydrase/acetyltransferase-like protein (isoleucine patch superfamily)
VISELGGHRPDIHPTAYVHETAVIMGRVRIGPKASVWPYAVLRGDIEEIVVGEGTNIQDNTVIHTDPGAPVVLGDWISVGHAAVLHGCRVGGRCLVGMGSILLTGSVVEEGSMVAAGALLSPGARVPKGRLALGVPARAIRDLTPEEIQHIHDNAANYVGYSEKARAGKILG